MNFPFREAIVYLLPGYLAFYLFGHVGKPCLWEKLQPLERAFGGIAMGLLFVFPTTAYLSYFQYSILKKLVKYELPEHNRFWYVLLDKVSEKKFNLLDIYHAYLWFYIQSSIIITLYFILRWHFYSSDPIPLSWLMVIWAISVIEVARRHQRWVNLMDLVFSKDGGENK